MCMILSIHSIRYFKLLSSKVTREMASYHSDTPYFIEDDPIVSRYEVLRKVLFGSIPIKKACLEHNISRSSYYEIEERFIQYGLPGLFSIPGGGVKQEPSLEQLVLIVKKCRPSVSQIVCSAYRTSSAGYAGGSRFWCNLKNPQLAWIRTFEPGNRPRFLG